MSMSMAEAKRQFSSVVERAASGERQARQADREGRCRLPGP